MGRGGPVLLVLLPNCPIVPGGKGSLMWGSTVIQPPSPKKQDPLRLLGGGRRGDSSGSRRGQRGHCHLSFTAASPSTVPHGFEPNAAGSEFPHDPTLRTVFDMSENLIYKNETKRGGESQKRKKGIPFFCGQSNFLMVEKIRKRKKKKKQAKVQPWARCARLRT